MTRLNRYITEQEEDGLDTFIEVVQKNCKPFLREIKGSGDLVYRGIDDKKGINGWGKLKVRKNRKPRLVKAGLHKILDGHLHEKFGWYPRSEGLFCGSEKVAGHFGYFLFAIFPIGKFKYIWKKDVGVLYGLYDIYSFKKSKREKTLEKIMNEISNYTNKNLKQGIKGNKTNKTEYIIKCNEYYAFDLDNPYYGERYNLKEELMERLGI